MSSPREAILCTKPIKVSNDGLAEMVDSAPLISDPVALRKRFAQDGFLLLRGVVPRDIVQGAKMKVLNFLNEIQFLEQNTNVEDGILNTQKGSTDQGRIDGTQLLCKTPEIKRLLEGSELKQVMQTLLGGPVRTFDYKWLRAVATEEFTGCHTDSVYMGRGTKNLVTCWIPFMDIAIEKGVLAVCKGSNSLPGFQRVKETYGAMDVDKDDVGGTGWFTNDPYEVLKYGGQWQTVDFRAGDVVVFTMNTFHASTVNTTNTVRISCDVRFQLESEPVDDRWVGENPPGHTKFLNRYDKSLYPLTMEEAKVKWGLL